MAKKIKDFDAANYKTLEECYAYLAEQAITLEREHHLLDVLVAFRNQQVNDEHKQRMQWEVEAFLFSFSGSTIFSFATAAGPALNELSGFPVLDDFQAGGFEYLKMRAAAANNPFLAARYYHLLWKGQVKNKTFAKNAIAAYIETINESLLTADPEKGDYFNISSLFERLIFLAGEAKENLDSVKALANDLLYRSAAPFYAKESILTNMLVAKSVFKPLDFEGALAIFEDELRKEMDKGDPFLWNHHYFKTAMTLARKLDSDLKIWYERQGDCFVKVAERETENERAWMKFDAYTSAVQAYRNAGHKEKRQQTEQLLFELKPKVKLPTVRVYRSEAEIRKLNQMAKFLEASANELLKETPEVIYSSLIRGWIYPTKELTTKASQKEKFFYEEFLTPVFFDRNKNIKKSKTEDHSQKKFYDFYHNFIDMVTTGYLFYTFIPGIRSGHLTYRNFIAYLAEHTWLGKPYLKTDLGGNELQLNLIPLVSPAIIEYFVQVQAWQLGTTYRPNFMLAIDSLTLKMEGLFRYFSEQVGVSTTVGNKDGLQEVYLHNVLDNPAVTENFDEDDLQFFKYLFANEGGINLRNNVAHAYYHFNDYHLDKFHLLLAALLKIAQYNFKDETES